MNSIERLVLQMIGEDPDNPDVFVDTSSGMAQIRDSINDAIEEIAIVTGGYRETYTLSLKQSTPFYTLQYLNGSLAWITDVFLKSTNHRLEQTDFIRLTRSNPRWLFDSGPPRAYIPVGYDQICVWPKPGGDTGILEIKLVMVPSRYDEDTDRIKVRSGLEWAAAKYAIGEYYASRGDAQSAVQHHMQYADVLGIDLPYTPAAGNAAKMRSEKEPWPKEVG
jgi:hypothetical protein